MYNLIAFILCLLLEVILEKHGASTWLWVPVGLVLGLLIALQIILPLLVDFPRAIWLIAKGRMRLAVFGPILLKPIFRCALLFLIGLFWASSLDLIDNGAVNAGANFGTFGILFSLLWSKSRSDFVARFNATYGIFSTNTGWALRLAEAKSTQPGPHKSGPS